MSRPVTTALPAAPGWAARRTLPVRVEAVRQLRRRRTLVVGLLLGLLPLVVAAAFAVGGEPGTEGTTTLLNVATSSGPNFAATCLFLSAGFLLVVPVALFCGDTIAAEAGWSSLRYLLAAPVPRGRLLASKLAVGLLFSAAAIALLPLTALAVGTVRYGWHPLEMPTGGTLPAGESVGRLAIAAGYVFLAQLVTAALAFWLSTVTDAPLGAVGGALGLTILGNILDAITALGHWRDFLPAHWQYAWADAFQQHVEWTGMLKGASVSFSYALVLLALAARHFTTKDVVS
ncbi:ABC transporter permease [Streptomyces hoynatensis]|uniref:ABC transporter permease n=1 Tax=Streptomyces hoynatensis TaxID=1141874 RepID=A0A3A9Z6C6_9ACTN|nr:ABC transporter permease [Streptomyces hoynatensis]RKN43858.1 ABC transporter permease [Streptomyces hoynatensis]